MYVPSMERKCGVKNALLILLGMDAVSVLLLGVLHYIYSPVIFSFWSLFFRIINGVGDPGITYQFSGLAKRLFPSHFALIS